MIGSDIQSVLDHCLQAVARGATVEEAFTRHPRQAAELRPLLEVALRLRTGPDAPLASPAKRDAARTRYLMRASKLRRRRIAMTRRIRLWRWFTGATLTPQARLGQALAAFVFASVTLGGATVWASSSAGADSALYGVKLVTEQVRFDLTPDSGARAGLALNYLTNRERELRDVLAQGKAPNERLLVRLQDNTEDAVALAAASGDHARLARAAEHLDDQTRMLLSALPWLNAVDANAAAMLSHQLDLSRTQRDFISRLLETESGAAVARTVPGISLSAVQLKTIRQIDGRGAIASGDDGRAVVLLGGQTYPLGDGLSVNGDTISGIVVANGSAGHPYVIAYTQSQGDAAVKTVRVEGRVAEATSTDLRIGDHRVLIDSRTVIAGSISAGSNVVVKGVANDAGDLRATEVHVLDDEAGVTTTTGTVQQRSDSGWIIGGSLYVESGGAEIALAALEFDQSPVGSTVRIEWATGSDGRRLIRRLNVLPAEDETPAADSPVAAPPAPPTETPVPTPPAPAGENAITLTAPEKTWRVEGVVAELDGGTLVLVSGATMTLADATTISGKLVTGARVAIELRRGSDGASIAVSIVVLNVPRQQGEDEEPVPAEDMVLLTASALITPTPAPARP